MTRRSVMPFGQVPTMRRRSDPQPGSWVACATTRDEVDSIGWLVRELFAAGAAAVYIADAGSRDGTCEAAEAEGATVLRRERGLSIAGGHIASWAAALDAGAERILTIDAGGSHDPAQASKLVRELERHDVAVGSRFAGGGVYVGGPRWRSLGSRLAGRVLSIVSGVRVRDWTSAYRAYRSTALDRLIHTDCRLAMHGYSAEVLLHAAGLDFGIAEVPIVYRFGGSSFRWKSAAAFALRSLALAFEVRTKRKRTREEKEMRKRCEVST